ncbi:MAG: hypothetical protein LAT84_10020 [Balneolia bacterium]|nr:hypothetical protein [Balneolia bacterium]
MTKPLLAQNRVFLVIAAFSGIFLLIPLVAMLFTSEVMWDLTDFLVMGALLFTSGSVYVLAARRISRKHRLFAALGVVLLFLWIWAEMAVGVFTNWGS